MFARLGFLPVFAAIVALVKNNQHYHRLLECYLNRGVLQLGLQLGYLQIDLQQFFAYLFEYSVKFVIQNLVFALLVCF